MYPATLSAITDPLVRNRMWIERRIVTALIDRALALGYALAVDDGEERSAFTRDRATVLANVCEADAEQLIFRRGRPGDAHFARGAVYLVYGNAGYDVIADHTHTTETLELLEPIEALARSLER